MKNTCRDSHQALSSDHHMIKRYYNNIYYDLGMSNDNNFDVDEHTRKNSMHEMLEVVWKNREVLDPNMHEINFSIHLRNRIF